jgi:hypothetical protein
MAAEVDIVNRALSKLGEALITSLDDKVKAARLASAMYETVRDTVISAHAWGFARARTEITPLDEKPAFGWERQYLLPTDCLRVLEAGPWPGPVMLDLIRGDTRAWELEGRNLLTNLGPVLRLVYLRRVTDVAYFPPSFVEALACKLAVEMAEGLAASGSKREMAWREYDLAIKQAKTINVIQLPPQAVPDDTWAAAFQQGVI